MSVEVRRLAGADLPQAIPLLHAEGWTFDESDLQRLLRVGGASGAFEVGKLVALLTFVDAPPLRWIGNVVTAPAKRGQGLGARILADALADAPRAGLYAVEKAVPLYERAGFVAQGECIAHRAENAKPLRPSAAQPFDDEDLLDVQRFDREATGLDRAYLLRELHKAYAPTMRVVRRRNKLVGYGVAKTYPDLTEIGPIVSAEPDIAATILDALLAATDGPHEMGVLGANVRALGAAKERGFGRAFRAIPMFRGAPPDWKPQRLAATAGMEKG